MPRRKQRTTEIFSLSFMDCICCGFGAVILIFVITTGRGLKKNEEFLSTASSSIVELEAKIIEAQQTLAQKEAALMEAASIAKRDQDARQRAAALADSIESKLSKLESLDAQLSRITDAVDNTETPAEPRPLRQTQPEYLTEFNTSGKRIVILLEGSGGMLGDSVDQALIELQKPFEERINSAKWTRARKAVETLMAYLPENALYQVYTFNKETMPLYREGNKDWLAVKDPKSRAQVLKALNNFDPNGGANHENAFKTVSSLQPDNVVLITDGLPTLSDSYETLGNVSEAQRLVMMREANKYLPKSSSVNILLFPMSGDPGAAPYFWRMAYSHNGSLISPSSSWPE